MLTFLHGGDGDGADGGGGAGRHAAAMTLLARPADDETRRQRAEWRYDVSATPSMHATTVIHVVS